MPLTQQQLNQLRTLCQQNPVGAIGGVDLAAYFPGLQANQCACWRWTTSGFHTAVGDDPAWLFTAIMLGSALNPGSVWANAPVAQAYVNNRRAQYLQYQANNYQAVNGVTWNNWFTTVESDIATAASQVGGLVPGAGARTNGERYFVVMHFDRTSNGQNNAPNYTHWWLKIDLGNGQFCCLEMFPGSTNLACRINNAYAVIDNVEFEVTDLTADHLGVLNAVL